MNEQEIIALKEQINKLVTEGQSKLESLTTIAEKATEREKEINDANAKILELKSQSETGNASINEQLQKALELLTNITTKQNELDAHYGELINKPNETDPSKLEKVNSAYQKIMENGELCTAMITKLKELESNVVGNKENNVPGLKEIFEAHDNDLKAKKKEWEERYTTLFNKIEGLLPGASSTGLASAYQEQRKTYNTPYWIWSGVFMVITGGMIAFAIYSLHDANDFLDACTKIISRLPFFVPAIWLAVFASKQQSQNKRLQEEYIYKETLSKSYEAYKREIEKLPDSEEKTKILEKLLSTMVGMADYNPSQTLQMRHHNDRPPILSNIFNKNKGDKNSSTG